MKNLFRIALAASATALAAASYAAEPIVIGVSIAQSPPGSVVQGTQVKDGVEIAVRMLNDKGGVLGRPLKVVYEDNQGIPEKGRAATEKLITRDKVVAVTGGHQSSVCLAEIEVAHRYKTPYVNTNCWSDDIRTKGYPEVFNPGNYNTRVSSAMAETIAALKVKSVVAFAENTDYGIGQAKLLGEFLKQMAPQIQYKYVALDRAGKDFTPAVLPLRANPPDLVVNVMLPPAAYILMNQFYEQGVAPSAKTAFYDGAGIADYPDFWQNVKEAGKYMLAFGLYHPAMPMPALGKEVGEIYQKQAKTEPNRLIFQGVDSVLLVARAIEQAKSTDGAAIIKALQGIQFEGARGKFSFSQEPGYKYQQWVDIPYVTYQLTEVNQPVSKTTLIQVPGQPLQIDKVLKPAK
ncbi:MAG: ABC transporter substrate-binding protein [Lautropia sp.]|jgi:ABC-type branched-subunit amino acid transport system substrate-binding protein|nr:MAG: ABC transporter substrate-binding protein [Pseudomonadota bacterium]MBC6959798.1 ABC transporter substrate-binding protein [Lautropia sp.]MCL4702106.1 ABC transporter substrate-binding protein [Burkholderiaceae bacterium]MCZ2415380.1 ABC transporter substrate-binding protein [Burkholderiales bacterium]MDL1908206.1 ABC transporter substrate-binding protein [Betaproteobacteria bacterium PRO1]